MRKAPMLVTKLLIFFSILALVACSRQERTGGHPVTLTPAQTATAGAVLALTPIAPTATLMATTIPAVAVNQPVLVDPSAGRRLLPAPLYFIDSTSGQIKRIEMDGVTQSQITHESEPVLDFDLSPVDGHLVYVSGNDLIEAYALGNNRRVLVEGPAVPLVNLGYSILRYGPTLTVAAPRFSPDGQQIAFGLGGINLIAAAGPATTVTILASDPYTPAITSPMVGNYYLPYAWSPTGARLLVQVNGYWEGLWWAIVDPHQDASSNAYQQLPACCFPIWNAQGEAVYLSVADGAIRPPGLQRFETASGVLQPIVEQVGVGFPHVGRDGLMLAFVSFGALPPAPLQQPAMHRIELDATGAQLIRLRADEYSLWEALWGRDDSGAVIVERNDTPGSSLFTGLLIWLPADGGAAVNLHADGSQLRWGATTVAQG